MSATVYKLTRFSMLNEAGGASVIPQKPAALQAAELRSSQTRKALADLNAQARPVHAADRAAGLTAPSARARKIQSEIDAAEQRCADAMTALKAALNNWEPKFQKAAAETTAARRQDISRLLGELETAVTPLAALGRFALDNGLPLPAGTHAAPGLVRLMLELRYLMS